MFKYHLNILGNKKKFHKNMASVCNVHNISYHTCLHRYCKQVNKWTWRLRIRKWAVLGLDCPFLWSCSLKGSSAAACLPGSRVQIPNSTWMFVFCVCYVSDGPCGRLVTRPEEFYRVWVCVSICVWSRNLNNEAVWDWVELLCHRKNYTWIIGTLSSIFKIYWLQGKQESTKRHS